MTRSELVLRLAQLHPYMNVHDAETIVSIIFDEISAALARGERVELRGFGALSVRQRASRQGRNPRTGESVAVSKKYVPFFKTGKQLRDWVNGKLVVPDQP